MMSRYYTVIVSWLNSFPRVSKRLSAERGFTLIETMVAMGLVTVIAATALPAFREFKQRSYETAVQSDFRHIQQALFAGSENPNERLTYTQFNRTGPGPLPGDLSHISLSEDVTARFIMKTWSPLFNDLFFVSVYHPRGRFEYRWVKLDAFGIDFFQKIPL